MSGLGQLHGHVAIVSGAGRGFGRAIAQRLAEEGASVTCLARSKGAVDEVAAAIEAAGGRALAVPTDVTVLDQVRAASQRSRERFGAATLLVHCAGVHGTFGPTWSADPSAWWHTQEVHLRGALHLANEVVPDMIAAGAGRIVNVASLAGTKVIPNLSAYCVAKSSLIRFTEHLAEEGRAHGVTAFAIEPGTVVTDLAESTMASPDAQKWNPRFVELLRALKEKEAPEVGLTRCAAFCATLLSGRCDALTGRYLTVHDDLDALLANGTRTGGTRG